MATTEYIPCHASTPFPLAATHRNKVQHYGHWVWDIERFQSGRQDYKRTVIVKYISVKEKDFVFEDERDKSDLFTLEIRRLLVASKKLRDWASGTQASLGLCVFHNGASPLCTFPVYMLGSRLRSRKPRGKGGYHWLTIRLIPTISE